MTINQVIEVDPGSSLENPKEPNCVSMEETEEMHIDINDPSKIVKIGKKLDENQKSKLAALLREFVDIFAWEPKHMSGIPETTSRHSLHIKPGTKPIRQ